MMNLCVIIAIVVIVTWIIWPRSQKKKTLRDGILHGTDRINKHFENIMEDADASRLREQFGIEREERDDE